MLSRRQRSAPVVRVLSPLRDFVQAESSGAMFIAAAAVIALVWANSPWSTSYDDLWHTMLSVSLGDHTLALDLRHWTNEGLMTVFFFVVGLEIKRELVNGHLSSTRSALLPGVAALGGMVMPAMIYLVVAGWSAPRGWAIPIATDIALALGVLAVAGDRVPPSLRAFLLGLAIVDDLAAIIVIAAFYASGIALQWLLVAFGGLIVIVVLRKLGVAATWAYVLVGVVVWYGCHEAGIHATIAGVAVALLAPSTPRLTPDLIDVEELADVSDADAARETSHLARSSVSVVEWLQHVLHPWTSIVVVPVFALANSGIHLSVSDLGDAVRSPITWGVFFGLLVGKPLGVVSSTMIAMRAGIAETPAKAEPRQLVAVGTVAGVGFTVALFITDLAFVDQGAQAHAKLAILAASVLAAGASSLLIAVQRPVAAVS